MKPQTGSDRLRLSAVLARADAAHSPKLLESGAVAAVAETAQAIACSLLERRGTILSTAHREAIGLITRELAELAAGQLRGRRAYALATGMGKTTAAAAFITALHQLGHHDVAVTVAASQVQALGAFRRELLDLGVPDGSIGVKHTVHGSGVPNTGDESRLYQLVTHVRARSTTIAPTLASEHEGHERALCIYDETLWRADTASMRVDAVRGALGFLREYNPDHPLARYLAGASGLLATRYAVAEYEPQGATLELPPIPQHDAEDWIALIEHDPVLSGNPRLADDLVSLLQLADERERLRVINTGQGKGLIAVRSTIPAALRHVAILDASTPIRELVKLDETVHNVELPKPLKTYENVQVFQRLTAGGRSSLRDNYRPAQLAQEVADIVHTELADDPARSFLIFTFKDRGNDKPTGRIRAQLERQGIDLDSRNAEGKLRFEFLTWGQQEGLNGYAHCNTVILAGVLTRDQISIAAAIKGQAGDPRRDTPEVEIQKMIASEVGHCVYQAASRGSCRVAQDGKAQSMHLHILHANANLKGLLEPVMPSAVWNYPSPKYLPPSKHIGKGIAMLQHIREALASYPADRQKVSSQELKGHMGLDPKDSSVGKQFTRAIGQLVGATDGWQKIGWGVHRVAGKQTDPKE